MWVEFESDKPARRWYQFSILQIMEFTLWVAIGVAFIVVGWAIDIAEVDGMIGTTIAALIPGAPFGAAIGVFIGKRQLCAQIGLFLWPVALLGLGSILMWILMARG